MLLKAAWNERLNARMSKTTFHRYYTVDTYWSSPGNDIIIKMHGINI